MSAVDATTGGKPPLQAWLLARLALSLLGNTYMVRLTANAAAAFFIVIVLGWIVARFGQIRIPGLPPLGWIYIWPIVAVALLTVMFHAMLSQHAACLLIIGPTSAHKAVLVLLPRVPAALVLLLLTGVPTLTFLCLGVLPGLWLVGCFAAALPALLTEEIGPVDAMLRSYQISRGFRWHLLAPWLLGVLTFLLLQLLVFVSLTDGDNWPVGAAAHAVVLALFIAWQGTYFTLGYLKLTALTDQD